VKKSYDSPSVSGVLRLTLDPLQHCEAPQNAAPLLQWQRELSEILDLQRVRRGAIVTEYIQELKEVIRRRHGGEDPR
jgi:hypothetical protein